MKTSPSNSAPVHVKRLGQINSRTDALHKIAAWCEGCLWFIIRKVHYERYGIGKCATLTIEFYRSHPPVGAYRVPPPTRTAERQNGMDAPQP